MQICCIFSLSCLYCLCKISKCRRRIFSVKTFLLEENLTAPAAGPWEISYECFKKSDSQNCLTSFLGAAAANLLLLYKHHFQQYGNCVCRKRGLVGLSGKIRNITKDPGGRSIFLHTWTSCKPLVKDHWTLATLKQDFADTRDRIQFASRQIWAKKLELGHKTPVGQSIIARVTVGRLNINFNFISTIDLKSKIF